LVDVGERSTELIRRADSGNVRAVSLDLRASPATDRWIISDPPGVVELSRIHQAAEVIFAGLRNSLWKKTISMLVFRAPGIHMLCIRR